MYKKPAYRFFKRFYLNLRRHFSNFVLKVKLGRRTNTQESMPGTETKQQMLIFGEEQTQIERTTFDHSKQTITITLTDH